MKARQNHRRAFASHGLALLIGGFGGLAILDNSKTAGNQNGTSTTKSVGAGANEMAETWIGDSLGKIREKNTEKELSPRKPLTMAEQLRANRVEAEKERKEYADQVDEILAEAPRYANEPDPAAAIRENMRAGRWQENHSMAIFQAWIDKDPEAALAELARNWKLQESEDIPLLLERKFGREWLAQQIGDDDAPYRFRNSALDAFARDLAWDGGLDGLLKAYNSIANPKMKLRLVYWFSWNWPLDDPAATARILSENVPVEMRNSLLDKWKPPTDFGSSFPMNPSTPFPYMSHEWYHQLCEAMAPGSLPDKFWNPPPGTYDDKRETVSVSPSLSDSVETKMKAGGTREDAVKDTLSSMVWQAMEEGTDLGELYGEGKISRKELLEELSRRIPGSEMFPDALEGEAWRITATISDPRQAAEWTAALSKRGDMVSLLGSMSNASRDPRRKMRLEWNRIFAAGLETGPLSSQIQSEQVDNWSRWSAISPVAAAQWRDSLPEGDPLRAEIHKVEKELENKRKESP
ncbi:MAG: hypothetical protein ABIS50_01620 [Luteolibacter sp.]|uniref:hypothetical protein n=1 Tax=Luteolibacter sp. TaxID=1962973 RepID=UPI003265CAB0